MRILITAIGSMSAEYAIKTLKTRDDNYVVGTDIYPKEWHYESQLCDAFYKAPFATDEEAYINFLLETSQKENIGYIVPLTDLEIDVINRHRDVFAKEEIVLCMQNDEVLSIARDKYNLYQKFADDDMVPSVRTEKLSCLADNFPMPCIAKPYNGRSSEGLIRNANRDQLAAIIDKDNYIVQEQISGNVYTVDYCRCAGTNSDIAAPREELLRTKNGAGLTVKLTNNEQLISLTHHVGQQLNINGCVNMEFIENGGLYYLIDINPRFSAGVSFSDFAGYNMVNDHMKCFTGSDIEGRKNFNDMILIKKYQDVKSVEL